MVARGRCDEEMEEWVRYGVEEEEEEAGERVSVLNASRHAVKKRESMHEHSVRGER